MGFCTAAAGIAVPVTAAAQTQGALISLSGPLFDLRMLLLVGVVCGATVFAAVAGVLFLRAARKARRAQLQASEHAAEYERKRDFLKAVLAAEPQYLIHWNEAGEPAVVADTLTGNLGIPAELEEALRFDGWLERDSVIELSSHLEKLRSTGQGFNLMLKSRSGAHIEADGRAAGGGSVLKLRDLAGRRRELAELCDTHLRLGKENAMLRAVLDAVPTPVWLQKPSGEIEWANRAYCRSIEVASPEEAVRQQAALLSSSERAAAQRVLEAGETYHAQTALSVAGEKTQYAVQLRPVGQTCAGIAIE
ncbi:MAG: PAS domain-containing protein, partial [Alphaproteobacteria bacterium]